MRQHSYLQARNIHTSTMPCRCRMHLQADANATNKQTVYTWLDIVQIWLLIAMLHLSALSDIISHQTTLDRSRPRRRAARASDMTHSECLRGGTYLTLSVYCTYVIARTTSNRTSFKSKRLDQPFLSILFGRKRSTRVEPDSSSSSSPPPPSWCRGSATCAFWRPRFSLPVVTTFGKTAVVVYRLIPQRDDELGCGWAPAGIESRTHACT